MVHDVLIVGAGIAGLSLARQLASTGRSPVLLERARGVGGRCATRRFDDQAVDHGVAVLHGRSTEFRAAMAAAIEASELVDWPRTVDGAVETWRHEAFDSRTPHVVPAPGVNLFARRLAHGLDVRLGCRVESLALDGAHRSGGRTWSVTTDAGDVHLARTLVLALPPPSIRTLLATLDPEEPPITSVSNQIASIEVEPCLTVIARYPVDTPPPAWDVSLPAADHAIDRILHDSHKRAGAPRLTLVIQAGPAFSRAHLGATADDWARQLLEAAAARHGAWMASPASMQPHRWSYARVVAGTALAGPLVATCEGAAVLGIAGDGCHPAGGVEGAFLSGLALATQLMR